MWRCDAVFDSGFILDPVIVETQRQDEFMKFIETTIVLEIRSFISLTCLLLNDFNRLRHCYEL